MFDAGLRKVDMTNSAVKMPKRCEHESCNVKLNLTSIMCKCAKYYCPAHRFSSSHNCSFDFVGEGKKSLTALLVKVEGTKIQTI
jgi:hypothetical protein